MTTIEDVISVINSIYPISSDLAEHLKIVLNRKTYRKGTLLLKAGQVSNRVHFIGKGLLRSFRIEDDKEYTIGFFAEGEVCNSPESFDNRIPSKEYVEALEDTFVISLDYDDLMHIYATYPEANQVGRIIFEQSRNMAKTQLNHMKMKTASERYVWFINKYPQLVQRVPGKYIASFLGMTEYTLSRIRAGKL